MTWIVLIAIAAFIWYVPDGRRFAITLLKSATNFFESDQVNPFNKKGLGKEGLAQSLSEFSSSLPINLGWLAASSFIGIVFGFIALSGFDLFGFKVFWWIIPAGAILAGFVSLLAYTSLCEKFNIVPSGNTIVTSLAGAAAAIYFVNYIPYNIDGFSDYMSFWEYLDPGDTQLFMKGRTFDPGDFIGYLLFIVEYLTFAIIGMAAIGMVEEIPYDKENKVYLKKVYTGKVFAESELSSSHEILNIYNLINDKQFSSIPAALDALNSCEEEDGNSLIEVEIRKSPSSDLHHLKCTISVASRNEEGKLKWNEQSDYCFSDYFSAPGQILAASS